MAEFNGGLKVGGFGGSAADPIENARVRIYDEERNELYAVFTNDSGETDILTLPAPDPSFSEVGGGVPYYSYNAEIDADGYTTLRIEGVQIFPNVISLQPANLSRGIADETLVINAPALWGDYPEKIPENEVKDVPEDSGFVVLDSVVIPDFVVPCFRVVIITCYNLLKRDVYRVF